MNDIHCRYCARPLRRDWQAMPNPYKPGLLLVTCDNPGCKLAGYTFSMPNYFALSLKEYVEVDGSR